MVKKLISMTEEDQDGQIGTLKASVEQIENKIEEISDQLEEIKNLLTVSEPRQPQQTGKSYLNIPVYLMYFWDSFLTLLLVSLQCLIVFKTVGYQMTSLPDPRFHLF